jgi:hypothetical protein
MQRIGSALEPYEKSVFVHLAQFVYDFTILLNSPASGGYRTYVLQSPDFYPIILIDESPPSIKGIIS